MQQWHLNYKTVTRPGGYEGRKMCIRDRDKMAAIEKMVTQAVLYAQQVLTSKSGAEKKAIVTDLLKEMLTAKNISITDEQLNILIEAAVKQMKMEENAGIVIEAVDEQTTKTE